MWTLLYCTRHEDGYIYKGCVGASCIHRSNLCGVECDLHVHGYYDDVITKQIRIWYDDAYYRRGGVFERKYWFEMIKDALPLEKPQV